MAIPGPVPPSSASAILNPSVNVDVRLADTLSLGGPPPQTVALTNPKGKRPVRSPAFGSAAETAALNKFRAIPNPTREDFLLLHQQIGQGTAFETVLWTHLNNRIFQLSVHNQKALRALLFQGPLKTAFLRELATQLLKNDHLITGDVVSQYGDWNQKITAAYRDYSAALAQYRARERARSQNGAHGLHEPPSDQRTREEAYENAKQALVGAWARPFAAALVDQRVWRLLRSQAQNEVVASRALRPTTPTTKDKTPDGNGSSPVRALPAGGNRLQVGPSGSAYGQTPSATKPPQKTDWLGFITGTSNTKFLQSTNHFCTRFLMISCVSNNFDQ